MLECKDVFVPIKLIETTDSEIISEIIKANNRQTEVKLEAFESLSEFHKDLEEYFYARREKTKHPLYYERRSKQYEGMVDIKSYQVISLATQLKTYISGFLDQPHSTHRYYGELLSSNTGKIFIKQHALIGYYVVAKLLSSLTHLWRIRRVDRRHWDLKYQIIFIYTRRFIKTKSLAGNAFEKQCDELLQSLENSHTLLSHTQDCCTIIDQCLETLNFSPRYAIRNKQFTITLRKKCL